jgi:hypothetical protein
MEAAWAPISLKPGFLLSPSLSSASLAKELEVDIVEQLSLGSPCMGVKSAGRGRCLAHF